MIWGWLYAHVGEFVRMWAIIVLVFFNFYAWKKWR